MAIVYLTFLVGALVGLRVGILVGFLVGWSEKRKSRICWQFYLFWNKEGLTIPLISLQDKIIIAIWKKKMMFSHVSLVLVLDFALEFESDFGLAGEWRKKIHYHRLIIEDKFIQFCKNCYQSTLIPYISRWRRSRWRINPRARSFIIPGDISIGSIGPVWPLATILVIRIRNALIVSTARWCPFTGRISFTRPCGVTSHEESVLLYMLPNWIRCQSSVWIVENFVELTK